MNRRDLVNAVANHTGRERKEVDEVIRGFTDVVTAVVAKGEPVAISGFAKFVKVDRPARMGRNPQTGEPVRIKATKKARITPLKTLKEAVVKPSVAPKLTRGTWPPAPAGTKAAAKTTKTAKAAKATKATKTAKSAGAKKAATKATARGPARNATATRKTAATRKSATARKTAARR